MLMTVVCILAKRIYSPELQNSEGSQDDSDENSEEIPLAKVGSKIKRNNSKENEKGKIL